ncbi:MAG TPA: uracil-DNA glycosylase, partial [Gammaproteobacteria bacterium]|nr:uracil-DNA glycosylase [Gammaproteobacteria bacterium]
MANNTRVVVDQRKLSCLNAMGITVWEPRAAVDSSHGAVEFLPAGPSEVKPPPAPTPSGDDSIRVSEADLPTLERIVAGCVRCALHRSRTQTVFGVGAPDARLMIIGEAPGADEDRMGEPFVGRAGRLLNAMLGAVGL